MALSNLLAAEPLIIARLKAKTTGLATIASASVLAGAQDIAPYCPAAFVLPGRGNPGSTAGAVRAVEEQEWQIVVVVRNVRDPNDVNTTATIAGPFLLQIVQALIGWRPSADHRAMTYAGRGEPYYEPGYGEFPLFFTTGVPLQGIGA